MPELPEVQTTVNGLRKTIIGRRIVAIWSDYNSAYHKGADNIKDRKYFASFERATNKSKVISADRRAKNILINLDNKKTILIHMKMTGHLLFGKYSFDAKTNKWQPISPPALKDPFNRHIHFVLTLDDGQHLALCDSRKFAKVTLIDTDKIGDSLHLSHIGPEPLDGNFTFDKFALRIAMRPNGKIKQVIMDQSVIAGIGNIYADEALWRAGIHPLEKVGSISPDKARGLFRAIKEVLRRGIDFGGDSMSDYRNIHGERGKFQDKHCAYRRTGMKCLKKGCTGNMRRTIVGTRSAHYCDKHQRLIK
ncbi:MAG: bifunctional DNA-formamidopyrimidine glycosylase/DNA-(apurinic or apyrimidinic site) lyase [Patescibacteria group bacterium]|nr:bifunctional DNA-formamidopyrimidine glycosylase/DNA-(apurinic or apyrimidinic site) lyase [Patescibacteria group bacterium]